jgi:hypothetical protein
MKFVSIALTILPATLLIGCGARQVTPEVSKRDLFEMKERCAESVARVLKYSIDFAEKTTAIRTHYNVRLNRCYVLQRWQLLNHNLPVSDHWVISDAQSFAHVDVAPGDNEWMATLEGEEVDGIVSGITQPSKFDPNDPLGIRDKSKPKDP